MRRDGCAIRRPIAVFSGLLPNGSISPISRPPSRRYTRGTGRLRNTASSLFFFFFFFGSGVLRWLSVTIRGWLSSCHITPEYHHVSGAECDVKCKNKSRLKTITRRNYLYEVLLRKGSERQCDQYVAITARCSRTNETSPVTSDRKPEGLAPLPWMRGRQDLL